MTQPIRLAVLASGGGTTLQNLIDRIARKELHASIQVLITSRPGIKALDRAAAAGIERAVVDRKQYSDITAFSEPVFRRIDEARVDLIVLAGWLSMIDIPARYHHKLINIHPALLPSFGGKGMYGQKVHEAVLAHGCKVSGCTVHFVDDQYDNGPIILQRSCAVEEGDTAETLAKRVFEEEKIALPEAIAMFQEGRLKVEGRRVKILSR